MRSNAIVRIILFSIVILVLLSILGVGIAADLLMFDGDPLFSNGQETVSSTGTVDAASVKNLSIEWSAGNITIRPADVTELTFTEYDSAANSPMVWLQSGDTLKISYQKKNAIVNYGNVTGKDLVIEVPRDWRCVSLEVETAASELVVEDLSIESVEFDGASGDFIFRNCDIGYLDVDTASGDLYFSGTLNALECDAVSADCEIILYNVPNRIDMDMASGDLDLCLPENAGFTVRLEALSGNLNSDFEITSNSSGFTCGDGACRIDISAMSGDVYIHKSTAGLNCDH